MNCFISVHKVLGPGLLESIYEPCLCHEISKSGLAYERQKLLPIIYDGQILDNALKLDILVENRIVIELKSVEKILPVHESQIISYLKLADKRIGFLVNFNVPLVKDGVKRFVNNTPSQTSASSAPPR